MSLAVGRLPERRAARFRQLLSRRPDRDIHLVIAPYHRAYHDSFSGEEEAQAWLRSLAAELPHVNSSMMEMVDSE